MSDGFRFRGRNLRRFWAYEVCVVTKVHDLLFFPLKSKKSNGEDHLGPSEPQSVIDLLCTVCVIG